MSIFYCHQCDDMADADDGCDEAPNGLGLICIDCMEALEDDAAPPAERPTSQPRTPPSEGDKSREAISLLNPLLAKGTGE